MSWQKMTRDEALTELSGSGYGERVARNLLFEAAKSPYVVTSGGALFIAQMDDGRFFLADVQTDEYGNADGAGFAALLGQAQAAGASRVSGRSPLPGWC
jgi:hypothetical protein